MSIGRTMSESPINYTTNIGSGGAITTHASNRSNGYLLIVPWIRGHRLTTHPWRTFTARDTCDVVGHCADILQVTPPSAIQVYTTTSDTAAFYYLAANP